MENNNVQSVQPKVGVPALKNMLSADSLKHKFNDVLGKNANGFTASFLSVVQNSDLLSKAEVGSIIKSAMEAAALNLPINPNLGFAAIVPYNDKKSGMCLASFQIQRDGWVELCMRSGQFRNLINEVVYDGELVSRNRFTGEITFDESKRKENAQVIGYMASFELTNGYKKTIYWTTDEVKEHAMKYSQSFKNNYGLWKTNFNAMALKTVLKHLLKKYAPKSITSIQKGLTIDDEAEQRYEYANEAPKDVEYISVDEDGVVVENNISETSAQTQN